MMAEHVLLERNRRRAPPDEQSMGRALPNELDPQTSPLSLDAQMRQARRRERELSIEHARPEPEPKRESDSQLSGDTTAKKAKLIVEVGGVDNEGFGRPEIGNSWKQVEDLPKKSPERESGEKSVKDEEILEDSDASSSSGRK